MGVSSETKPSNVGFGQSERQNSAQKAETPEWLELVLRRVGAIRYGVIQLIVHDGRVTQVDFTEKTRITGTS